MGKILLVGDTPFFSDHISFLLKLSGFEAFLVRNLEEAVNLIEINRSLHSSNFDLLILEEAELNDGTEEYFRFINNLVNQIEILVIGIADNKRPNEAALDHFLRADNVFCCTVENLVFEAKKIFSSHRPTMASDP